MKIVINTKYSLRHKIFLVEALRALGHDIVHIFIQKNQHEIRESGIKTQLKRILSRLGKTAHKKKNYEYELKLKNFYDIPKISDIENLEIPITFNEDINSKEVQDKLNQIRPDLILVFGGKILKGNWIDIAPLGTINLHYGILPYYRSGHSSEFALYHEAYNRVGATIHYIDKGVDTGAIIRRFKINPAQFSDFSFLLANVYKQGIDGLIQTALEIRSNGKKAQAHIEKSSGSYFPGSDFNTLVQQVSSYRISLRSRSSFPYFSNDINNAYTNRRIVKKERRNPFFHKGIYIFLYHSIVDSESCNEWETAYSKVATSKKDFEDHLSFLKANGSFCRLSEIPELLYKGSPDRPYFVISFDDGYKNILNNCSDFLEYNQIRPVVFVNRDFISRKTVYYRVLVSLLYQYGFGDKLKKEISKFSVFSEKRDIKDIMKDHYSVQLQEIIIDIWNCYTGRDIPDCFLNNSELLYLKEKGWEIGNHTCSHSSFSLLSEEEQYSEIMDNQNFLIDSGLDPINWVSYPNGKTKPETEIVMDRTPGMFGLTVTPGYNFFYSKNEYFRIPVANDSIQLFKNKIIKANRNMSYLKNKLEMFK